MRDVVFFAFLVGSLPVCFMNPYYGVLMWYWISYFNPHRFTFGFAYNLPVAFMVAVPTLAGILFARKSLRSLLTAESVLLVCLWAWYTMSFIRARGVPVFAGHLNEMNYEMDHISKIILMTLIMVVVVTSRQRIYGVMLEIGRASCRVREWSAGIGV